MPAPRRTIDVRMRAAQQDSDAVAAPASAAALLVDAGVQAWARWQPSGAPATADTGSAGAKGGVQAWWQKALERQRGQSGEGQVSFQQPAKKDFQPSSEYPAKKGAEGEGEDEEALPAPIMRLSKNLASLLRHRASDEGLCVRSDGFARLDEVLSLSCMQRVLEHVAPGSAGPLNTGGAGGPVEEGLLGLVREMVGTSHSKGRPRFELWEGDGSDGGGEVWIRATHKHSLAHVTEVPGVGQPPEAQPEAPAHGAEEEPNETCLSGDAGQLEPLPKEESGEEGCRGEDSCRRPAMHLAELLGDSRGLAASREVNRDSQAPAGRGPCVVPKRVMAPRVVPPPVPSAENAAPAPRNAATAPAGEPCLPPPPLDKCQPSAAAPGVAPPPPRDAFRDVLNVLPADAPAGVRAYLAKLAEA